MNYRNGNLSIEVTNMTNAAFDGTERKECARMLEEVAEKLKEHSMDGGVLRDINGNEVGHWSFQAPEDEEET